jgi:phosphate starvation-inducible PhoH-like protein
LGVNVTAREGLVHLRGEGRAVAVARSVLETLGSAAERNKPLSRQQVLEVIADQSARVARSDERPAPGGRAPRPVGWEDDLNVYAAGRAVRPKTANQETYLEAIRTHDLVFATGPAGTGKTYLAVAAAVHLLRTDQVRRLMLVRPAVEAGERLGFLPGDLAEKVNPYLRPLFDALQDMLDYPTISRFMSSGVVEVAPLAFMRGRTLNNAVIILDEAQNTTKGQMKMFLTRMGQGSKTIVTGDTTQIDLPDARESGLIDAVRRLRRIKGAAFVTLDKSDVVRHELVQRVVEAYGEEDGAVAGEERGS